MRTTLIVLPQHPRINSSGTITKLNLKKMVHTSEAIIVRVIHFWQMQIRVSVLPSRAHAPKTRDQNQLLRTMSRTNYLLVRFLYQGKKKSSKTRGVSPTRSSSTMKRSELIWPKPQEWAKPRECRSYRVKRMR